MTDLQSLQQLRERVSKLEGPDPEIDWLLIRKLLGDRDGSLWAKDVVLWHELKATASIDAALALVERVLPGKWSAILGQAVAVMITRGWAGYFDTKGDDLSRLPQAVLLALLDALISEKAKAEEPA